jgi:predicted alpha/beta hydrolase family esterase
MRAWSAGGDRRTIVLGLKKVGAAMGTKRSPRKAPLLPVRLARPPSSTDPPSTSNVQALTQMPSSNARVLTVAGLWNSGPEHWQTYWERERGDCARVQQSEWETPRRQDWVAKLEETVATQDGPVVLAAHSLGCATVAHFAEDADPAVRAKVFGALLVAPSDVEAPLYPPGTEGFAPMPLRALPFPTIVVASTDDEYVSLERAEEFARAWGARFLVAGALGHINSASHLGSWPEGQALLDELLAFAPAE